MKKVALFLIIFIGIYLACERCGSTDVKTPDTTKSTVQKPSLSTVDYSPPKVESTVPIHSNIQENIEPESFSCNEEAYEAGREKGWDDGFSASLFHYDYGTNYVPHTECKEYLSHFELGYEEGYRRGYAEGETEAEPLPYPPERPKPLTVFQLLGIEKK